MADADYRLMTEATGQRIAAALEALHLATVTGVKGDAEANYRHGDVNLTPANIGAVSTSAVIDIPHGGTGETTPEGACAALAPGIPTSSYSLISTYGSGVAKYNSNGDANNLRCIKFGNGLKRLTGLFRVTAALSGGAQICVFPSGFSLDTTKNGSIQAFPLMISTSGATVRTGQMSGGQILLFSSNMPSDTYIIDQFYF